MLFSHKKVVITQFNASHWIVAPIYAKSLTLNEEPKNVTGCFLRETHIVYDKLHKS